MMEQDVPGAWIVRLAGEPLLGQGLDARPVLFGAIVARDLAQQEVLELVHAQAAGLAVAGQGRQAVGLGAACDGGIGLEYMHGAVGGGDEEARTVGIKVQLHHSCLAGAQHAAHAAVRCVVQPDRSILAAGGQALCARV